MVRHQERLRLTRAPVQNVFWEVESLMDAKGEFKATNLDQRVQETISDLSDADLLKMLEASPRDYTPYALGSCPG